MTFDEQTPRKKKKIRKAPQFSSQEGEQLRNPIRTMPLRVQVAQEDEPVEQEEKEVLTTASPYDEEPVAEEQEPQEDLSEEAVLAKDDELAAALAEELGEDLADEEEEQVHPPHVHEDAEYPAKELYCPAGYSPVTDTLEDATQALDSFDARSATLGNFVDRLNEAIPPSPVAETGDDDSSEEMANLPENAEIAIPSTDLLPWEYELLQCLETLDSYTEVTVGEFAQYAKLPVPYAKTLLDRYSEQGLTCRRWAKSAGRYSLTAEGQSRLQQLRTV